MAPLAPRRRLRRVAAGPLARLVPEGAAMTVSSRRRGADAERAVVSYLQVQGWPDARRYLSGDGRQPGDIDWHPLICVEVKDRAQSKWPTWCRQACAEKRTGTTPAVVRRTRGVRDVGSWETRIPLAAWLSLGGTAAVDRPLHAVTLLTEDDETWIGVRFADLVAAVRALDAEGA